MRAYDPRRALGTDRVRADPWATVPVAILSAMTLLGIVAGAIAALLAWTRYGPGIYPPAVRAFYLSGPLLVVNGVVCAASLPAARRVWGATGRGHGLLVLAIGVAMLGGVAEHDDPRGAWRLLYVPLGVALIVVGGWLGRRPRTDRFEPLPGLFRAIYVLLGLAIVFLGIDDLRTWL